MTAILCDLDGLLVDSEQLHFEAYRDVLKDYGVDLTLQMFVDGWLSGKQYGTYRYLTAAGFSEDEIHAARMKKAERFGEMAKGKLEMMPGAREFLERVKADGLPCGIGTGGYEMEYSFMADECGLRDYVSVIVGGTDVEHNKPAPDIYLKVAEALNANPADCVVFENSDIGAQSALNAGMRCIVIPSALTKYQDFSELGHVYSGLNQIDLSSLESFTP